MRKKLWIGAGILVGCSHGNSADSGVSASEATFTATAGTDDGNASSGSGPGHGDTTDGGPMEVCDGYDNDEDGQVDEVCSCDVGEIQECYVGPPDGVVPECRHTTQTCEPGGGDGPGVWGPCGGLCEGSTLSLDDAAMFRVLGAAAGDQLWLATPAGFADINRDGELDFAAPTQLGDGAQPDIGATSALFGGACLQRSELDLATTVLDGHVDADGHGGFRVDPPSSYSTQALVADIDGDGSGDVAALASSSSTALVFGSETPSPVYDTAAPDGISVAKLTGGGSPGMIRAAALDFDGDGYADMFVSSSNGTVPVCPCSPNGLDAWFGRSTFAPETPADVVVAIGIPHVGDASKANFSVVGGGADFNADGYGDITAGNGAANDSHMVPYVSYAFFGNSGRTLPGSMTATDGSNGFRITGGSSRGNQPNHQHGDFNGDGTADLVLAGYARTDAYVLFGAAWAVAADVPLQAATPAGQGVTIASDTILATNTRMGLGDIDADGFDDLVIPLAHPDPGGVVIVWGRELGGGAIDPAVDPESTVLSGSETLGAIGGIAVADVDGDGMGDLLISAPNATTVNGEQSGAGLVKFGNCLADLHNPALVRGNDGADDIVGTAGGDAITSERGDDRIEGGGGADVLYAGAGNDVVIVDGSDFVRVDGGLGDDTLRLRGAGTILDFHTMGGARVREFERFDLGASGAQVLSFNPGHMSTQSTTTRTYTIEGDGEDSVTLSAPFTASGPDPDGYLVYTHGAIVVRIAPEVSIN